MESDYYDRPMVRRLIEIFGEPKSPPVITEKQFDDWNEGLLITSKKSWHEINEDDYWHYLMDLRYVDLQQDLFDYVFPAFLIRWWEGQLMRTGGPASECDFYDAIDHGEVFRMMMDDTRRRMVYDWMIEGYIQGVDQWSGNLSTAYNPNGPDNLHGPLSSFHALGQSIPILPQILTKLMNIATEGRAQFWLVLATGIVWVENEVPYIPKLEPDAGGGGVYILFSATVIYDHGYLPENLEALRKGLTLEFLLEAMLRGTEILSNPKQKDWAADVRTLLMTEPITYKKRLDSFLNYLSQPNLGGVVMTPLGAI